MTKPTDPPPPDRGQHAPGISKTLEEGAAKSRMVEKVARARRKREEGKEHEEEEDQEEEGSAIRE